MKESKNVQILLDHFKTLTEKFIKNNLLIFASEEKVKETKKSLLREIDGVIANMSYDEEAIKLMIEELKAPHSLMVVKSSTDPESPHIGTATCRYAEDGKFSVSTMSLEYASLPGLFHELAHCIGKEKVSKKDYEKISQNLNEITQYLKNPTSYTEIMNERAIQKQSYDNLNKGLARYSEMHETVIRTEVFSNYIELLAEGYVRKIDFLAKAIKGKYVPPMLKTEAEITELKEVITLVENQKLTKENVQTFSPVVLNNAVVYCIYQDHPSQLKILLTNKNINLDLKDVDNVSNDVIRSAMEGNIEVTKILAQDERINPHKISEGVSLIEASFHSSLKNDLSLAEILLKRGADANFIAQKERGHSALMMNIQRNNAKAVDLLLKYGAKADFVAKDGETPLLVSFKHLMGREKIAKVKEVAEFNRKLLAYGADPNALINKRYPVEIAMELCLKNPGNKEYEQIFSDLIEYGASLDVAVFYIQRQVPNFNINSKDFNRIRELNQIASETTSIKEIDQKICEYVAFDENLKPYHHLNEGKPVSIPPFVQKEPLNPKQKSLRQEFLDKYPKKKLQNLDEIKKLLGKITALPQKQIEVYFKILDQVNNNLDSKLTDEFNPNAHLGFVKDSLLGMTLAKFIDVPQTKLAGFKKAIDANLIALSPNGIIKDNVKERNFDSELNNIRRGKIDSSNFSKLSCFAVLLQIMNKVPGTNPMPQNECFQISINNDGICK